MSQNKVKIQGSKIARQTAARLAAVQAVYQMRANAQSAKAVIDEFEEHRMGMQAEGQGMVTPDVTLFTGIVEGVSERVDDIKGLIDTILSDRKASKASNSLESLEPLLASILCCGGFELLAHNDIDAPIIISDYLDVTHAFYEGGEGKLINGLLDRINKMIRKS